MLGERIKARRNEFGMSLRELADQVDLTASFLSQIERDQADPSIKSLRRIADALGVPILHFLAEEDVPHPVVRKGERKKLVMPSEAVLELLTPNLDRKMVMFVAHVQPSEHDFATPLPHPTEECILVLEGILKVTLDDIEYLLEAGDSIYFEGACLCSMYATGDQPLVFISAMTPPAF